MQALKNQSLTLWLDTATANLIWCWQHSSVWRPPEILPANTHRMPALAVHYIREGKVSILYFGSIGKWMQREMNSLDAVRQHRYVQYTGAEPSPPLVPGPFFKWKLSKHLGIKIFKARCLPFFLAENLIKYFFDSS